MSFLYRFLSLISCLIGFNICHAGEIKVQILTVDNKPLSEAVVWLTANQDKNTKKQAVMDQIRKTFVPYILPVQVGTTVDFPNSDSINHHVYSFSPAKRFELKLTPSKNTTHTVLFDKAGIVTLGCNIHDWMLGYIVVLESAYFAQTDKMGIARIAEPEGGAKEVQIWHPQINDDPTQLVQKVNAKNLNFKLTKALKPDLRRNMNGFD
ncbi:methylamine utilization protein [Agitococcus lubricus]|uniref:Plastocyanin n=1 Tax=Agitococcus lubricus TaxID=1077255 RepID=A0A2T5J498_9GAMM|nr:methylamine utilization protein [Agitococcus lubricus]PTQ91368.1 hypothetical protein C8N29_101441 [Agitococcus lubricus]